MADQEVQRKASINEIDEYSCRLTTDAGTPLPVEETEGLWEKLVSKSGHLKAGIMMMRMMTEDLMQVLSMYLKSAYL